MVPELRLMFVSRHIYLLGAALVNLMTGLCLQMASGGWQRRVAAAVAACRLGTASLLSRFSSPGVFHRAAARLGRTIMAKPTRIICAVCGRDAACDEPSKTDFSGQGMTAGTDRCQESFRSSKSLRFSEGDAGGEAS
jgi:hypothetical protein